MKRIFIAAAWAALLVTLLEVGRVVFTIPTEFNGAGEAFAVIGALLGVLGAPLLIAGLVIGSAAALGTRLARWGHDLGPLSPARRVAWLLVGGLMAAGLVFTIQPLTQMFWRMFRQKMYAGLATGLSAVGFVAVMAVIGPVLVRVVAAGVDRLGDRLPRALDPRRALGAIIWAGLGLAICAGPVIGSVMAFRSIDLGPARLLCLWLLALAAFGAVRVDRHRWLGIGAMVTAVVMLLGLLPGAFGLNAATAQQAIYRDGLVSRFSAAAIARTADGDGDSVPDAFGGQDCDDAHPTVRPGAYDVPNDGIDQSCSGADYLGRDPLPRPHRAKPQVGAPDWHVVLVTVDALRHDVVAPLMPQLSAVAAESVVFKNAYAHGAATYWSVPSMLASTLPSRLNMACSKTPEKSVVMLPEVLGKHGYTTAMFTGTALFFRDGLRQGIKHPDFKASNRTGAGWKGPGGHGQTSDIFRFLDKGPGKKAKKLFLWSHYYDPHYPYFEIEGFPPENGSPRAKYDAIVRYTDVQIGRLVQRLKDRGLWEKTIFIVTADHGEAFGEHGHRFHGRAVYDESVKVPLIVRVPGVAPREIDAPIGLMDVSTTLVDLLELPTPRSWIGRSWRDALNGKEAPKAPVFTEILPDSNYRNHMVGMRLGDFKFIHRVSSGRDELYDMRADPAERRNLADVAPEAPALKARVMAYVDHSLALLARNKAGTYLPPGSPKGHARRCAP